MRFTIDKPIAATVPFDDIYKATLSHVRNQFNIKQDEYLETNSEGVNIAYVDHSQLYERKSREVTDFQVFGIKLISELSKYYATCEKNEIDVFVVAYGECHKYTKHKITDDSLENAIQSILGAVYDKGVLGKIPQI